MKYPEMRKELLDYLEGLSSVSYQQACWIDRVCPPGVEYDEFDYAVHFLFDDTSLASEPERLIGYCLRDEEEAEAIKVVCRAIDAVLQKHGSALTDAEYIQVPEWRAVIDGARSALDKLNTK